MPVIPALWEARRVDHLRSGVQDQPDQNGKTPSLPKIQKLAWCGGKSLQFQLLKRLRKENCLNLEGGGCSKPRLCHCRAVWATEQDSAKRRGEKRKRERERVASFSSWFKLLTSAICCICPPLQSRASQL